MDNKQDKEFKTYRKETVAMLNSYYDNMVAISILRMDMAMFRQSIEDDTAINTNMAVDYSVIGGGHTNKVNSVVEQELIAIEDKIKQLRGQIRKLDMINKRIDHVLDCLPAVYSKVLRLRYLERKEWKEVTRQIGYSYSQQYVQKEVHIKAINMATGYLFNNVYNIGLFLIPK